LKGADFHPDRSPQMTATAITRDAVDVDGAPASFLTAGAGDGPLVLLLHGTYWSRVWLPALEPLAAAGLRPLALDLRGCGRSGGELTRESATVPALSAWVERVLDALDAQRPLRVAGHDIGGAIAQRLAAGGLVERLALVNSVTYDSWPVPGVARYRDPAIVAATSTEELVAARRTALTAALGRPTGEDELAEYLSPWTERRVARSWMALAAAADPRYTLELVGDLQRAAVPTLLLWGEDDTFQRVEYAERYAAEIPGATLRRLPGSGHIPMESAPGETGAALAEWFGR
jgi:pimeloyl-ACP methyl ester carboxylesterase